MGLRVLNSDWVNFELVITCIRPIHFSHIKIGVPMLRQTGICITALSDTSLLKRKNCKFVYKVKYTISQKLLAGM